MQEQEIELIDLLRILWKRKKLILLGTLMLTVIAAGVSLLLPKVYEVSAIIEPGKIVHDRAIFTPEVIRENILGEAYDTYVRKSLNLTPSEYPKKFKVTIPKATSLVKISIETAEPEQGAKILDELLRQVTAAVNEKVDIEKQRMNNDIQLALIRNKSLVEKISLTKNQMADATGKIKDLETNRKKAMVSRGSDAMSLLLYSNEVKDQQVYYNNLQEKLNELETEALGADLRIDNLRLTLSQLKATNLVKPPTVSEWPVKPKKSLIVALAFMSGLLGTTLLAFVLEYFERVGSGGDSPETV